MATLSSLPGEIRNIIYGELLTSLGGSITPHNNLAVLRTSKLLHSEASSHFYQRNPFAIKVPGEKTPASTILPPIADRYTRYLRQLSVHVNIERGDSSRMEEAARAIKALTDIGAHFESLHFIFSSRVSRVLNARVDDSILHAAHPLTISLRAVLNAHISSAVKVELQNTWFGPGVSLALAQESRTTLDIVSASEAQERAPTGQFSNSCLAHLGLDEADIMDAEVQYRQNDGSSMGSLPVSLCSALAELDAFSATEYAMNTYDDDKDIDSESSGDGHLFFDMQDIDEWTASDEGREGEDLSEADDVDDEDMEDVSKPDANAIIANIEDMLMDKVNEADVTHMTNFAPELLGRWLIDLASLSE